MLADDTGNNWSGIDLDPRQPGRQVQLLPLPVQLAQVIEYLQRTQRGVERMRAIVLRHAAHSEIGIADRLELFQAMLCQICRTW